MIKRIESKDGEGILVRPFSLRDFRRLHRMSSSISQETRRAYRAMPQPRPPIKDMRRLVLWGLVETKLALSSIGTLRDLLAFIPRMAFIAFVAVNSSDQVVGFRFLNIVGRKAKHRYIAETGMVLTDDYKGKGIGPPFQTATWEMVDDEVLVSLAEIYDWNLGAIRGAEKVGYRKIGTYRDKDGEVVWLYARGRGAMQLQSPPSS